MMKANILVVSFEGLLSPVFQNQFMPAVRRLSTQFNFSIIAVDRRGLSRNKRIAVERERLAKMGIQCYTLPQFVLPLKLSLPMNVVLVTFFTLVLILFRRIDILHFRRYDANFAALIAKRVWGKKLIFDPRGLFVEEKISSGLWQKNRFRARIYRYLENSIIEQADAVISFSRLHSEHLQSTYGEKIGEKVMHIPNCVDLDKYRFKGKRRSSYLTGKINLVYIGGASYWHMVDEMIFFFKYLKQRVPAFFTYLAYEGCHSIAARFAESKLEAKDYCVASVPPEEIPQYLTDADIGIALIKPSLAKRVCAPIKFVEYLAAGLPVVINPGIGETEAIVKRYGVGVIYERQKIQSNVAALLRMAGREDIRDRCRKVIERHYTLDVATKALLKTYQRVLRKPDDTDSV
jgi:glycosyltransferase involved in cell wall biosynthesis